LWVTGPVPGKAVEQALVVETPMGLVVVTGCSRPGVVNLVRRVRDHFDEPIYLVLGGFHVPQASASEVESIVSDLKALGVEHIGPTHCTGERTIALFRNAVGQAFMEMGAGRGVRIAQTVATQRGPYLGQTPPGAVPETFAPGIISTASLEHSAPAFSPDGNEVYWSVWPRPQLEEPQVILTMRQKTDGTWTSPEAASFSGRWVDGGPAFSPDGQRLYFFSKRPHEVPGIRRPIGSGT
jgi:hypothetical protein